MPAAGSISRLPLRMPWDLRAPFSPIRRRPLSVAPPSREFVVRRHHRGPQGLAPRQEILLIPEQVAQHLVAHVFVTAFAGHLIGEPLARHELRPGFEPALLARAGEPALESPERPVGRWCEGVEARDGVLEDWLDLAVREHLFKRQEGDAGGQQRQRGAKGSALHGLFCAHASTALARCKTNACQLCRRSPLLTRNGCPTSIAPRCPARRSPITARRAIARAARRRASYQKV